MLEHFFQNVGLVPGLVWALNFGFPVAEEDGQITGPKKYQESPCRIPALLGMSLQCGVNGYLASRPGCDRVSHSGGPQPLGWRCSGSVSGQISGMCARQHNIYISGEQP